MVAERKDWFSVSSAMKYLLNALLCVALLLLSGCIDGDEEIFLRADGGARVLAIYRVPTLLLSVQDAEDLRSSIEKEVGSSKISNCLPIRLKSKRVTESSLLKLRLMMSWLWRESLLSMTQTLK